MKRTTMRRRALSALLTLALVLTLVPTALAASRNCPECRSANCTWTTIVAATCQKGGLEKYVCQNCGASDYVETPKDPDNHDGLYSDNGDGETHSVYCPHDGYRDTAESHDFVDGRCSKCLAMDYDAVELDLPVNPELYVSVGDSAATVSLGDVALTLGSADVTDEYNLTYNWYSGTKLVSADADLTLPAGATAEETDLVYVCFVMATPKNSLSTQPKSASCTVTVRVRELITANAVVSSSDLLLDMDDTNTRTPVSVADQLYEAVYNLSAAYPNYVVFGAKPVSKAGELKVTSGRKYYFSPSGSQTALSGVRFEPNEEGSGTYTINFTAHDTKGKEFPGTLTITVEQSLGGMDVLYTSVKGANVTLAAADFEEFWFNTYSQGELTLVRFNALPTASQGGLYYDYTSNLRPGTRVKAGDAFYVSPAKQSQLPLDEVTFLPGGRYSGCVSIPFEAYGKNNRGNQTYLEGTLAIFVSDGSVKTIQYAATAGGAVKLSGSDFLSVYQTTVGTKPSNFWIQLLEVPAYGDLYLNYTGSYRDAELTADSISAYPFYFSSSWGDTIDDLTYVARTAAAASDTVRYAAYDAKGTLLYIGTINFTRGSATVNYTSGLAGVTFKSSDFERILGSVSPQTYLTFTPPTNGTLYFSKTGTTSGAIPVTAADKYYLGTDLMNVSNLLFVPKAGQSGTVSIPYTAYQPGGSVLSGDVKITVRASYTKRFTDVKTTDWFYTEVMDLAEAGVIKGKTATTFDPTGEVKYGEALKLIMLATGYNEQVPTGKHWASGYLTKAHADGLLSKSIGESYLERKIDRYAIAEIAARAMGLPQPTLTQSPFADMNLTNASAPYVLALYEAQIVTGSPQSNGTYKYFGVNSICRQEIAAIIWRINNYNG